MSNKSETAPGCTSPPIEHRFLKGTSGNKRGRPKGAVSLKGLARKVALKKHRVSVDGRSVHKTLLELVIDAMIRGAASGGPSMAALHGEIRAKVTPRDGNDKQGGLLVVPELLSAQEWTAQAERRNAIAVDPTTYVNVKAGEFCKAAQGIPTPLGEAMLAFHRKWG